MKIISLPSPIFYLICLLCLIGSPLVSAQVPQSAVLSPQDLETLLLPVRDNRTLLEQEMQRRQSGGSPRFAVEIPVRITTADHGRWDLLDDRTVWRLRLRSAGAHSLNLGFTQYHMPEGGRLFLYDPERRQKQGPFTPADNEAHNELWTPIFPGDELIIEVSVPRTKKSELALELSSVNHDFLGFDQLNSGSCNLDIVCGLADGWAAVEPFRDAARSVGMYSLRGSSLCTGFLVNNTRQDCTPYFLTAKHCEVTPENAASLVVYWKYENSTCRQPNTPASGQNGDGKLNNFNSGSIFRASWSNSDFCLLELDDPVNANANAYFSGWSAEDEVPDGVVASIHHPFSNEKRISLSDRPRYYGFYPSSQEAENGDHLIISSWSTGTTEVGSSGAPLFNRHGQVIGQLTGGDAACGNEEFDAYGRMYYSWEGGGTMDSRLRDWLDPIELGIRSFSGREQDRCGLWAYGKLLSGSLCVGGSDTLELSLGPDFDGLPTVSVGQSAPPLNVQLQSIGAGTAGTLPLLLLADEETPVGDHLLPVLVTYQGITDTIPVRLVVVSDQPETPTLISPADQEGGQLLELSLRWATAIGADRYRVQFSTFADFEEINLDRYITGTAQMRAEDLQAGTTYYWRVAAENACGISEWSAVYSFATGELSCGHTALSSERIDIPTSRTATITSELELAVAGNLASIEIIDLNIEHSWVGDLSVKLRSPAGTEVALLDRPGFPENTFGCDGKDLLLTFNGEFGLAYQQLETTCGSSGLAISGTYQALESLEKILGEPVAGTWTLIIEDQAPEDGGALLGWGLNICTYPEEMALLTGLEDQYRICTEDSLQIELVLSESSEALSTELALEFAAPEIAVTFSRNPINGGDTTIVTLRNFQMEGIYDLILKISGDGEESARIPFQVHVEKYPDPAVLITPAAGSVLNAPVVTFSWQNSSKAERYRLDIATDSTFAQLLQTIEVEDTLYVLELEEKIGEYYWRVMAVNDCGTSSSTVAGFTFDATNVQDLEAGLGAKVFPNPFSNQITLEFALPLEHDGYLYIRDITGRSVSSHFIQRGTRRTEMAVDQLASGVYVLEIRCRGRRYSERLIKVL